MHGADVVFPPKTSVRLEAVKKKCDVAKNGGLKPATTIVILGLATVVAGFSPHIFIFFTASCGRGSV